MKLYHYSHRDNLEYVDPNFYGFGIAGAERRRKASKFWLNRSYYGTKDYKPENGLGEYKYVLEVDENELYDISKDKDNLYNGDITELEFKIYSNGYLGYYASSYYPNIVAIFKKQKVSKDF